MVCLMLGLSVEKNIFLDSQYIKVWKKISSTAEGSIAP
jgi:hypothetical protein